MSSEPFDQQRLDSEWAAVSAVRELIRIATRGNSAKATYDNAINLAADIYPELLGSDISLLRRFHEIDIVREFRQRADAKSRQTNSPVSALSLVDAEIAEYEALIQVARGKQRTDKLKKRLKLLQLAQAKLNPQRLSENELIFRDAYNVHRDIPMLRTGRRFRDFELPDNNVLRVRVFHPDRPEQITGADIVYERYESNSQSVSIVAVQYKIWEQDRLSLEGRNLKNQLDRLKKFTCDNHLCEADGTSRHYRFPFCTAFLRPTDRLQSPDQALISTGEHLPICEIKNCRKTTRKNTQYLSYESICEVSLDQSVFEDLFTRGKIGSRKLSFSQLNKLYENIGELMTTDALVIHAQDFSRE